MSAPNRTQRPGEAPVGRKALMQLGKLRRRGDAALLRSSGVIPIAVIVMLAIVCVVVAVLSSAGRADDVELQQERLLLTNAIADRGHRVLRELENVAASHDVVYQLHYNFDRDWVHHLVGLRLNTFFDHDHVFVTDCADRLVYALEDNASADPAQFANAELGRVIDLLRGRGQPNRDEHYQEPSLDPVTNLGHPRGVQRLQTFMKRPAIVAGVVADLPALAGPISGGQPLIMTVKYLDGQLLSDIGIRFDLPGLRTLGDTPLKENEDLYVVADGAGSPIAHFAWRPNRPGTSIVGTVLPFMAVAFGGFA